MSQEESSQNVKKNDLAGFGERLREAFGGARNVEIARKLGVSEPAAKNYLEGRVPAAETLLAITDLTKCSLHWLLTGEGSKSVEPDDDMAVMADLVGPGEFIPVYFEPGVEQIVYDLANKENELVSDLVRDLATESLARRGLVTIENEQAMSYIIVSDRDIRFVEIELLGEIAAGRPLHIFEQSEKIEVPEEFARRGRETFALVVRGDSMIDEGILEGDIVICVKTVDIFNGETIVALIDGDSATVKKFHRRGSQVRLEAANKDYPPMILKADRVDIQGVVIGIYRRK